MAKQVTAGKYIARVLNYGIGNTKAGDPQAIVQFQFKDNDGDQHSLTWFGSFKEKALPYTLDALLYCGMKGNDPAELAQGIDGGALDLNQEVQIVVEEQTDDKGRVVPKISWVNRLGGNAFKNAITFDQAKSKLAAMNLKGAVMARRAETGLTGERLAKASGQDFSASDDSDFGDLPF